MKLAEKLINEVNPLSGKVFTHIGIYDSDGKSQWWEENNGNPLKGKKVRFDKDNKGYDITDDNETMYLEPKKIENKGNELIITSKGGLVYKFKK